MGIVKIKHRKSQYGSDAQKSSRASLNGNTLQEERWLLERDLGDSFVDDDSEEIGCELAMIGDHICNLPYELYNLPDLREILSLETWNSCLTEEERFTLAAFLPDVDQETFCSLMKDLLGGLDMFFGSPLVKLFVGLKSGLYSLNVGRCREALRMLRRQRHYHSLKIYHERMIQKFDTMKRTWNTLQSNSSAEERVRIWKRKNKRPHLLVDLNMIPAEEDNSCKFEKNLTTIAFPRTANYMKTEAITGLSQVEFRGDMFSSAKMKGKGVLKVRPADVNSLLSNVAQPLQNDPLESCRRMHRGVLKVKQKPESFIRRDGSRAFPNALELISADILDVPTSYSSPSYTANEHPMQFSQCIPSLHPKSSENDAICRSLEPSEYMSNQKRRNIPPKGTSKYPRLTLNRQRGTKKVNDIDLHNSPEHENFAVHTYGIRNTGEYSNGSSLHLNQGIRSKISHERYETSHSISSEPFVHRGISSVRTNKHLSVLNSTLSEDQNADDNNGIATSSFPLTLSPTLKEAITYKRKKSLANNSHRTLDRPIVLSKVEQNLSGRNEVYEKARTLKIRIKGFKGLQ